MTHRNLLVLFATLAVVLVSAPVWAHKVNIFAYVEKQTVHTESYFSGGRPVQQGRVLVLDSDRNPVTEGQTDENGRFSFPVSDRDDLTIVIEAGMGHKNSFLLKKSDLND